MPTFVRRPFNELKPETAPSVPTTADQRAQHVAGNNSLDAAYNDVEALETGKLDTSHEGAGGAVHADAVAGVASGFMSAADKSKLDAAHQGENHTGDVTSVGLAQTIANDAVTNAKAANMAQNTIKLRNSPGTGDPEDVAPSGLQPGGTPAAGDIVLGQKSGGDLVSFLTDDLGGSGGTGTVQDVAKDGSVVVSDAVQLDFRDSGDATVTVFDAGAGIARITVDATAGTGGGGIGKGVPFTVGEIMEISSDAGDGQAISSGLTASGITAALGSKIEDGANAGVIGEGVFKDKTGVTLNFKRLSSADSTVSVTPSGADNVDLSSPLINDTTPQLGGELQSKGQAVALTRGDDSYHALLGAMTAEPGAYFVYSADGASFDPADGGFTIGPGQVEQYGSTILNAQAHTDTAGRQLYVSQGGVVYSVEAPAPGWEAAETDTTNTARAGAVNAWQQLPNLTTTIAQALSDERLDIEAAVWVANGISNHSGSVEIGYGINGAQPTAGTPSFIPESFAGYVTLSVSPSLTQAQNDTIGIWMRVTQESNPQFSSNLAFDGTTTAHAARIATPGTGGPGGSGDVIQGTGGATGQVAVWEDFGGKLVHGTGVVAANVPQMPSNGVAGNLISSLDSGKQIWNSGIGAGAVSALLTNAVQADGTNDDNVLAVWNGTGIRVIDDDGKIPVGQVARLDQAANFTTSLTEAGVAVIW